MNKRSLHSKRALRSVLLVLLLSTMGMAKLQAENITFADDNVKAICVEHWDTNGDGELSYAEAAAVTALNDAFHGHPITSFNEFQYFTGVTSIEDLAFDYNSNLFSIIIPNSVTSIGYSFRNCENLNSFYLPASVTSIHHGAFESCRHMEQIVVAENNPVYDSREGCNAIIETASNTMIIGCNNTIIPNTVTTVEGTTFVGKDITSLYIPSSVVSFGGFIWCPIEQIVVEEGNSVYDSRNNCNAIIETSTNKLVKGCKNTVIPNTVTKIGESAFIDCDGITSITIPAAVTYIGLWAFRIQGLNSMTIEATTPPQLYWYDAWHSPFGGVSLDIPVYVPCGTIETYQNADVWNRFTNFIEMCNGDAPTGAIDGKFTINNSGDQVYFSQGNLQYIGSASTPYWKFADNQWDYLGDNGQFSTAQDVDRDLFCYGTSGYNHGAVCYQPWSTSTNNSDYWAYGNSTFELFDLTGKSDWGYNPISNGGNEAGMWRTMTISEWDFVLNIRSTLSGIRFARAKVNNVCGVILLPDDWEASIYELNNYNSGNYNDNIITAEDWINIFEVNGAVLLPVTGLRTGVDSHEGRADYWSSSVVDEDWARGIIIDYGDFNLNGWHYRHDGKSVRLVRPAQANTSYSIEAVPNPTGGGTITGAGTYDYYAQVTLTATANEGYTFYQWKENGNVVSTENTISFVALFDRNLEACFLENNTLLYTYNDGDHTATVIGHRDGQNASGDLVIPGTVMHNGETYTVTAIGDWAFNGCSGLTSVIFSNSLVSIGFAAFEGCSGLTSIVFPNTLVSISERAFMGCGLIDVVIPKSVDLIGTNPFQMCSNIEQITVDFENPYYDSRGNCNAIIETNTNHLVAGCENTIIPNTVTTIDNCAFMDCSGLTSIVIPASVSSIGFWAFRATGLTMMTIEATTPPELSYVDPWHSTFGGVSLDIPIYIPCGTLEAYQNAEVWSRFTNFIEMCNGDAPTGAIDGKFTINNNGDQVYFSQGNLQYQASTNTWRFALNQWETVGLEDNENASATFDGWIDKYDWATSGYPHIEDCYQPWSSCGMHLAYGAESYNLYDESGQADWGYNAISNGGNVENSGWRTVKGNEWSYLFNHRTTLSGIRYAKATVNGEYGVILFPDDWNADWYAVNNYNESAASYNSNIISGDVWESVFEAHGAVLLPQSSGCSDIRYCSASKSYTGQIWILFFADTFLTPQVSTYVGKYAVRLVRPTLEVTSYQINAVPNPSSGGTITGAGTFYENATCTLTATANEGYIFINWTRDNEVVATTETYSFTVTEAADYVANFVEQGSITNHWTIIGGTQYNMTMNGIILINGVEQSRATLEVGAFCGDECRGSMMPEFFPPSGQYVVALTVVSNQQSGELITFRLYDHEVGEELELQCANSITFVNNDIIGTMGDWYQFAFTSEVGVSATVDPEGAGIVTGTGNYLPGSEVTLTANANNGYVFRGWSLDGITVSTDNPYTFTVMNTTELVAHFDRQHVRNLSSGWHWWSTYIEQEGIDGLTMLEESLGHNGLIIKTQVPFVQNYYPQTGYDYWFGSLSNVGLTNEAGYQISVSGDCQAVMSGAEANPSAHSITLQSGWNWIGYPVTMQQSLSSAISGFTPAANDLIKGQNTSATYYANYGWFPTSFVMTPGESYMYLSNASGSQTLTYATSRGDYEPMEKTERMWMNDVHAHASNLTVLATVFVDGIEQKGDNLELGAFVDGECRGSAVLQYFEPTDRWYAVVTVAGEEGEQMSFAVLDRNNREVNERTINRLTYSENAVVGSLDLPYEVRFTTDETLHIYPNPIGCNESYQIVIPTEETSSEVIVYNTLGDIVAHKTGNIGHGQLQGLLGPGIYLVRVVCRSGNAYNGKLIVQ